MRMATAHVHLPVPSDAAFDYLSRMENLPEWATEFVESWEPGQEGIRARTAVGDATIRARSDRGTGVVDIVVEPDGGEPAVFPTRVVGLPDHDSLYAFTMVQAPGQSDEGFEEELASLRREMQSLPTLLDR